MEEPRDERDSLEPAPVTRQWSIPPTQEQNDDFDDILQHLRKSRSQPRNVSFSTIGIREYPLCLGDNPGCQNGVSIFSIERIMFLNCEVGSLISLT